MSVYFLASAAPDAYMIYDLGDNHQLPGSVTTTAGGLFAYQRGYWNGRNQVFDHMQAETLALLGERIAAYLAPAKTPGERAYEEDVRRRPTYHDGAPRRSWEALETIVKDTWEKNPAPRSWPGV